MEGLLPSNPLASDLLASRDPKIPIPPPSPPSLQSLEDRPVMIRIMEGHPTRKEDREYRRDRQGRTRRLANTLWLRRQLATEAKENGRSNQILSYLIGLTCGTNTLMI